MDYHLQLLPALKLYDVFHINCLSPWKGNDINEQEPSPPGPLLVEGECYNPPTNFSFLPFSGPPSTQPTVPPPQPISTAPAPAPPVQPAPLAFNPFHTSYAPLYHVTDFYKHPQGYAQLQQPTGSPHRQPLPPSPDPDTEMSSPTHASSSINHYSLLQPPSPRDVPMGTPPSSLGEGGCSRPPPLLRHQAS